MSQRIEPGYKILQSPRKKSYWNALEYIGIALYEQFLEIAILSFCQRYSQKHHRGVLRSCQTYLLLNFAQTEPWIFYF